MWLLISLVGIVLVAVIALQFPKVQNFLAQKGASYLANTLNTRVEIGGLTTDFRNAIVLKEVYLEDQQQDTLWYSERLGVDMKILALLKGEVNISKLDLQQATANIHVKSDSTTNYDFILDAFATDTTTAQPVDTSAAPLKINLDLISLQNIKLSYNDEAGGNWIKGRIGKLVTTMDELDLEGQRYLVDEVELSNTRIDFEQTKIAPPSESEPIEMQFGLNRVALDNIELHYANKLADQYIDLKVGQSELLADKIDVPNARIDLDKFELKNTALIYKQEKYKPTDSLAVNPAQTVDELDKDVEATQGQPVNWVLNLNNLDIAGLNVKFDNFNAAPLQRGMDYDHLQFSNVEINAEDILYSQSKMGLALNQLKLQEKSGFRVNNFNADITVDSTSARLANLDLQTGNSRIAQDLAIGYPSLTTIADNPNLITLNLDIDNTRIGMQDVLYFAPDMASNPSFRSIAGSTVKLDGKATGRLDNIQVQQLQVSGLKGTNIAVSGNIKNAMDPDKLFADLNINRFATTRTDVMALLPAGTVPPNIRIPNNMSLTGKYTGTMTAFDARADIRTSVGNLNAVVDMNPGPAGREPFSATVSTNRIDMAQLFTDSLGVGIIAMNATVRGTGLAPETMQAVAKASIKQAEYNNYTYNNINLNATINQNLYTVNAVSGDQNLDFTLNGDFNLRNADVPKYNFTLDLREADLQKLNFYNEPLEVQGRIAANMSGADAASISGILEGQDVLVKLNQVTYPIDSLRLNLQQPGDRTLIGLQSNIANADLRFGNDLGTLPVALQKHFSNYLDLQPDSPYPANTNLGDFTFSILLKNSELIKAFVPGLEQLSPSAPMAGTYNAATKQMRVEGGFGSIKYTDYTLQNLTLRINGDKDQLAYNLGLGAILSPSLQARNVSLSGAARDNSITTRLAMAPENGRERFVLGGLLNGLGQGYRFVFNPDQLVINYDKWTVPADNYLQFDTNLLYANNIKLQRDNSFILLNSIGPVSPAAPLQAQFSNFDIGYLMQSFEQQDSLVDGTINGVATVENLMAGNLAFTSDINVTDFTFQKVPVGNIALKANSATANRYNLDAALTGNGNQLTITGFYEAQPNASLLNLDANVANLSLASLQGFTMGMVKDMGGNANGKLRITGTLDDPNILGQLNFNQAQFNVSMLNSLYRLQNERLVFNEQGINFPNFTITDSLGQNLTINGNVLTQNYMDYRFDLRAETDRFLAMNSTAKDNDLYYGTVYIGSNATITGTMLEPVMDIEVNVLDGSAFTAVVPADEAGAAGREGIVEFVTLNDSLSAILGMEAQDSASSGFVGAKIDVEVNVTDATPITIIIDPVTGDNLVVRGTAEPLYVGILPNGQMNMTGRYTITDGKYSMAFYDIVSRELDIAKGSYIAWQGDPMQADFQISAIYNVETAPMELVASQINNTDNPSLRNQVPFQVFVNLSGELLRPEIGFDIRLPEEERGSVSTEVTAALARLRQDESEMNKQVFALLVLNRFMAPDPLASSGGGFAASARNSISGAMTDQLNNLTNRYAGGLGLELGVDSYEDYSSGSAQGRTDLNVALRQQFLNDRLTVRVGSDIGLEGQREANNKMGGFGGNISVEYSLTADGRLRVQAFQRNQYEDFEGDVRATGAALIYQREYNNFSDLFRSMETKLRKDAIRREEENIKSQSTR